MTVADDLRSTLKAKTAVSPLSCGERPGQRRDAHRSGEERALIEAGEDGGLLQKREQG